MTEGSQTIVRRNFASRLLSKAMSERTRSGNEAVTTSTQESTQAAVPAPAGGELVGATGQKK